MAISSATEAEDLIKARYPLLYVVSSEEARVEEALRQIALRRERMLAAWSITRGFVKLQGEFRGGDVRDPIKALDHIAGIEGAGAVRAARLPRLPRQPDGGAQAARPGARSQEVAEERAPPVAGAEDSAGAREGGRDHRLGPARSRRDRRHRRQAACRSCRSASSRGRRRRSAGARAHRRGGARADLRRGGERARQVDRAQQDVRHPDHPQREEAHHPQVGDPRVLRGAGVARRDRRARDAQGAGCRSGAARSPRRRATSGCRCPRASCSSACPAAASR